MNLNKQFNKEHSPFYIEHMEEDLRPKKQSKVESR